MYVEKDLWTLSKLDTASCHSANQDGACDGLAEISKDEQEKMRNLGLRREGVTMIC